MNCKIVPCGYTNVNNDKSIYINSMIQAIRSSSTVQENIPTKLRDLEEKVCKLHHEYLENEKTTFSEVQDQITVLKEEMNNIQTRIKDLEDLTRDTVVSMAKMMNNVKLLNLKIDSSNHSHSSRAMATTTTTTTTLHHRTNSNCHSCNSYTPKYVSRTH